MGDQKAIFDKKAQTTTPVWSSELGETPAGVLLTTGEWLLLAAHQAGTAPTLSRLRWLNLADGQPGRGAVFEGALIGGIRPVRFEKPDGSADLGDGVLVAVYSADALGHEGALLALDAAGEEVWRWAPGVSGVSAPALAGGTAWVTTNTGFLVGLDLETGAEQARIPLDVTPSLSAPALAPEGDVVTIPCRGPHLLAMGMDGQVRWRFEAADQPGGWLNHTPVIVGEHLFAALNRAGLVMALRLADGTLAWQVQVGPVGKDLTPPATDGERLYVGSREGLHALDPAGGREVWRFPVEHGLVAAPVVAGGVVYIAGRDHRLVALDAASGQEVWHYAVERRIEVPPLITAGPRPMAIVADHGGTLTALYRPLSAAEHAAAAPSLAVEVQHGELVLNTWTRLRFVVRNQGGGPARQLIIHARGGQFEGQVADTRRITTVQAGQTREDWLDIRPLACGDSVPLRVSIEYQDYAGTAHTWQDTLYLPVAPVQVIQEKPMAGIPSTLYSQIRQALLDCGPLTSDDQLSAIFAHPSLKPWRTSLPQAPNPATRADAVIAFLAEKRRADTRENALVLLLRVLSERHDPADECRPRLARLASELELALSGGETSTRPLTASNGPAASESPSRTPRPDTPRQVKPSETNKKDFFVSYNKADCQWAVWIAWQLEAAGYTTIIQAWDFPPGGNFIIEMHRATEQALRTVAVLSPDYLEAFYTQPEWAAAFAQDPTGEKGTLLLVRVRECKLKGLLSQIIYIDLVGLAEEAARETLLARLKPGRAKPITEPIFPAVIPVQTTSRQPDFPGGHTKHQTPPELSEDKLRFLCYVYLRANSSALRSTVNSEDVAKELGLTQLRTIEVADYLERKGLINFETWDIGIKITHQGVVKIESDLLESRLLSECVSPDELKRIEARGRDRFQFLYHLNEKTEGDTSKKVLTSEMASDLDFDHDQVLTDIIPYLNKEGWIKIRTIGNIAITEEGVEHLLRDLKAESERGKEDR